MTDSQPPSIDLILSRDELDEDAFQKDCADFWALPADPHLDRYGMWHPSADGHAITGLRAHEIADRLAIAPGRKARVRITIVDDAADGEPADSSPNGVTR